MSAKRSSSTVLKRRTHNRFSFRVRMNRSAQPLPSGARTKAGELSMQAQIHPDSTLDDVAWEAIARVRKQGHGVRYDAERGAARAPNVTSPLAGLAHVAELPGEFQHAHLGADDLLVLGHGRCPLERRGRALRTPTAPRPASAHTSAK